MKDSSGRKSRLVRQILETERDFGLFEFTRSEWNGLIGVLKDSAVETQAGSAEASPVSWETMENTARTCTRCRLCEGRTNVVFGEGNRQAELLFIGEGPGFEEDRQGKPFVGKAGQLLTRMIEAMGLKREVVYIANCVKCRPPGNRNPLPDEIAACQGYLLWQIQQIKPKVICALGKFAAQTLLQTDTSITRLRGNFKHYHGIALMPTFHPAYLLRNPDDKKLVWEDLKKIMSHLGLPTRS